MALRTSQRHVTRARISWHSNSPSLMGRGANSSKRPSQRSLLLPTHHSLKARLEGVCVEGTQRNSSRSTDAGTCPIQPEQTHKKEMYSLKVGEEGKAEDVQDSE